jgi:hypothetical protein
MIPLAFDAFDGNDRLGVVLAGFAAVHPGLLELWGPAT